MLPWDFILILLVMTIVVPWRGATRIRMLLARPQLSSAEKISLYGSTIAFQWLGTALIVWRAFARGLNATALGLSSERPVLAFAIGSALAVALGSLQVLSLRQLSRVPAAERGHLYRIASRLMPQSLLETLVFVALVCTVSLCEELMYRGFAFAAFKQLGSGSITMAVVGSSALFAIGHIYQGPRGVANTFVLGLLLAGTRVWTGSLLPPIMAHLAVDMTAGWVGRQTASPAEGPDKPRAAFTLLFGHTL